MDLFDSDIEPFVEAADERMNGSCGGPTTAAKTKGSDEFTLSDLSARHRNAPRESSPKRRRVQYASSPMTLRTIYKDFAHLCVSLYTTEDANSSVNWKHMISVSSFEDGRRHCLAFIMKQLQLPCPPRFYIGITGDPVFRWDNPLFGHKLKYRHCNVQVLLKAGKYTTRAVEDSLIKHLYQDFQRRALMINERHSPQGVLREEKEGEHYLYVIFS